MLKFEFPTFPVLSTDRLTLRAHTMADVADLFVLRTNDRVHHYINRPKDTFERVKELTGKIISDVENNQAMTWAICLKGDSKLVGNIGFWRTIPEHHRAELGYILHPDLWNQGIVTEALSGVLKFGFEKMKLHSVEATVNPENISSIRVLEKHGFVREAYFREDYFFDGKFYDSAVYCLLSRDYLPKQNTPGFSG